MENPAAGFRGEEEQIVLPPGFRFHPTDEELISHYLSYKALDVKFTAIAIGEADLNKCEPWDLPQMAKMGETEWYFFSLRDRKYPTGLRTNRATGAGYWKATGKDKEIYKARTTVVGMKKTLVFYKGRAPKGEKSNWIMHEYRLFPSHNLPSAKNEWVICRVFHKTPSGEKKFPILNQTSTYIDQTTNFTGGNSPYVRSFSRPMNPVQIQNTYQTIPNFFYRDTEAPYPVYQSEINPFAPNPNPQYPFAVYPENNMYMGPGLENNAGGGGGTTELKQGVTVSMSQDTAATSNGPNPETSSVVSSFEMGGTHPDEGPSGSMGPDDFDSFWDF